MVLLSVVNTSNDAPWPFICPFAAILEIILSLQYGPLPFFGTVDIKGPIEVIEPVSTSVSSGTMGIGGVAVTILAVSYTHLTLPTNREV